MGFRHSGGSKMFNLFDYFGSRSDGAFLSRYLEGLEATYKRARRDDDDDVPGGRFGGRRKKFDDDDFDFGRGKGRHDKDDKDSDVELSLLATFDSGLGEGAAEIVAHDPESQRLFVTNAEDGSVDILDISDPKSPTKIGAIDITQIEGQSTGGPNSVAVAGGIVAVAIEAEVQTDPGLVAFFDADGAYLASVEVGALPDMLTFTPDGQKILVANEGEPDDGVDPKAAISFIDMSAGPEGATVTTVDFTAFDAQQEALEEAGLRIFEGKLLSDDVEPEFIAISEDGSTAFVTLQEANAVAVVDIASSSIVEIQPLGTKDHSLEGNGIDPSDRDDGINIQTVPVHGMFMPDAIASYDAHGETFYVTANEGDARDEDDRVKDLTLDPTAFPDAVTLQLDENLGRLEVSTIDGDTDGDGDFDQLFSYGARSFTIWDEDGNQVFDSGDLMEQVTAELTPELFNANDGDPDEFDNRSDAKGPEPESVVIGDVNGSTYAFVGLERAGGGVMVFDISKPTDVEFIQYIRTDGDIAPEGLDFISAKDSPIGVPLLVVANEVSGTTSLYQISFEGKTIKGSNRGDKLLGTGGEDDIDGRNGNDKIFGFAGDDELSGGNGNDQIYGGFGDDEIDGGNGKDLLKGGAGDDEIDGGNSNDKIYGQAGDDEIEGGSGNDYIAGGAGDDEIEGNSGKDRIFGGDGDDEIDGNSGKDQIFGGAGNDDIDGGSSNDLLEGGAGNDDIDGGSGNDDISGDAGDDEIDGGSGRDAIDGGAGNDMILGGSGNDEIDGGDGDDDIDGGGGRDQIDGGDGDDELAGGSGNDEIDGGDGDDILMGGAGNDDLDGGDGLDTAVFAGNRDDFRIDFEDQTVRDLRSGRPEGRDSFDDIEFLQFDDQTVSLLEDTFTLQILHASDLEGGLDAIGRAANFAAIVDTLEDEFENSVTISAGDNWIPSPFFNASGDAGVFRPLFEGFYNEFFGLIDLTQVDDSADTNGDGFFDNSELDSFIQANGLAASDVYTTDINGDGFPDYFEEIDNHEGRGDISIMNIIGFDASALGNHEFDVGSDALENIINYDSEEGNSLSGVGVQSITDEFGAEAQNYLQEVDWPGGQFPYLSANLDFSGDGDIGSLFTSEILLNTDFESDLLSARDNPADPAERGSDSNDPKIAPATIIEEGGELIGVVGATTQLLESLSSPTGTTVIGGPFTADDMAQLASVLQPIIDDLIAGDAEAGRAPVNKIILTSHLQQIALETELAGLLSGVDVIIAGGSDTLLADSNDRLRPGDVAADDYPVQTTDANGDPVLIVSTDGEYSYVGRLVVEFDSEGRVITLTLDENVSGAFVTDDQGVLDVTGDADIESAIANSEKATDVEKITDAVQGVVIETDSNVFGETDVFLDGVRTSVRTEETNMGNLTADANLAAAQSFDDTVLVSIKNGGGIRAPIGEVDIDGNELPPPANPLSGKEAGEISQLDIENTLRFNNALTLITLTPEQLLQVLEHGVAATAPGATPGQFAQVGGISFSFDPDAPSGARIQNAALVDDLGNKTAIIQDGAVIEGAPEAIRIVTLNFLANGGDNYPYPDFEAADPTFANRIDLNAVDPATVTDPLDGNADFADFGTEQDALAEFLAENHPVAVGPDGPNGFAAAETDPADDLRIQNLSARADTVLDGAVFPGASIAINEIRIDQPSTDNDEYFELFGDANASLDGLHYLVIGDGAAGSGVIEEAIDLSGLSLNGDGFFTAAEATFSLGTADLTTGLNFENSDNVTHLLVSGFTGTNGDDLDTDDDGVLDVTPFAEIVDSVALVETPGSGDQVYSDTQVGPDGTFVPAHVFRLPDGSGDFQVGAFDPVESSDTPGAVNEDVPDVLPVEMSIFDIQGAGHRSAVEDTLILTTGIVTAISFNGFYLQDPVGDGDIATSDGIFVLGDTTGIAVGDNVDVEGTVDELQFGTDLSVTRILANSTIVNSSGNALPDAVVLGVDRIQPDSVIDDDGLTSFDPADDAIDFLESLEGMRVEVDNPLVVAGTSRFDEVALAAGRGGESGPGLLNAVVADGDFNPEILLTDDVLVTEPNATTGDTFTANPVGVLDYTFGAYKLQLTETTSLTGTATEMTIATYNAFNLDPSDGDPGGAADRLDSLASNIVTNLGSPDIIALQEIQDNNGGTDDGTVDASDTLQELVDAIALAGGPTYSFAQINPTDNADGGAPGSNIRNAFLFDSTRVDLDETTLQRIGDDSFDAGGDGSAAEADYAGTRKPLVGEFTFLSTGDTVTVIGNHLKSKRGDDGLFGENQPPVENTLVQRVDQATAVNDFVADILAVDANANVVVLGDMNDFQFSDTLAAFANANGGDAELTNLVDSLPTEDQYSFIFNGNSQVLDHILVSDNIAGNAPEVDIVHANLDFGFPGDNPSDHDPIVARIDLSDDLAIV